MIRLWTAVEKYGIEKLSVCLPHGILNPKSKTPDVLYNCKFEQHNNARTIVDLIYEYKKEDGQVFTLKSTLKVKDIEIWNASGKYRIYVSY